MTGAPAALGGDGPVVNMPRRRRRLADRLAELWRYRHLIGNLVIRDLKVRYKNSVLGFFWSLASPLLMMLVFWFLFGVLWNAPGQPPAFHAFVLVGVLTWNWFSLAVSSGIGCIVNNASLINKVYFPREALPIAVVLGELVNFLLALPVLMAILWMTGRPPTVFALWLPAIIAVQGLFTVGVVFFLATANVYYRDVSMVMEVVLLAWFFLSPVFYDYSQFRERILELGPLEMSAERLAYIVNPIATLIANYRTVLYGGLQPLADGSTVATGPGPPDLGFLLRTLATGVVILAVGWMVFQRHAGRFGEEV